MTRTELFGQIKKKESYLCVGLDTDISKIPKHLLKFDDPIFEFNRQIIEATKEYSVAYKPNLAFYESVGPSGLESLLKTVRFIPDDIFTIADAKRGDLGNTAVMYAKSFFEFYHFDSVTIVPYMGHDSVKPFLDYKNKWAILLALTSNPGADDFEKSEMKNPKSDLGTLFGDVLMISQNWGTIENMMYVVGANRTSVLSEIRKIIPEHFLLIPGVGAQGGNLEDVSKAAMNKQCGMLVNSSRQIIYASSGLDFAEKAGEEAKKLQQEMKKYLDNFF